MGAPTDPDDIVSVEVYQTTAAGEQVNAATIYQRTGSFNCTLPDGTTVSMPYTRTQDGYPEASRCNVLAGCDDRELDHVGVKVTYRYHWKTPIGQGFGAVPRGHPVQLDAHGARPVRRRGRPHSAPAGGTASGARASWSSRSSSPCS